MRKILNFFFPLGTKRRNFLFQLKHKVLVRLKSVSKIKSVKKGEYTTGDGKIYDKYQNVFSPCYELKSTTKKVAVHLHLYYKDLLEEMITYLNNIPFSFDLYVSVVDLQDNDVILSRLNHISKVKKVVLKVTKNSGRDYGPMMVEFGKILEKYDYVCHIHTKKSLRMGESQDQWRHHLLNGVLGSKSLVRKIFYLFEHENVGIFFPDSVSTAPYWANTWMGAKNLGVQVCKSLDIPFKDEYQDFSVGSMFWVRTTAAKDVFRKQWTWEEFGEERGLNDGTLAYVFERIFVLDSNKNGYDFICYEPEKNIFYRNYSERNRTDYYAKNKENFYQKLKNYDVISFDIFDTLITRMIVSPNDIFELMNLEIDSKFFGKNSFSVARKKAELLIAEKISPNDPSIDQIYEELSKQYNISLKQANTFKKRELELENKFLIPRQEMLEIFNRLKKEKKEIILISDMYLTKKQLNSFLEKCGYTGYRELYVSSETNLRKDRADIWPWIKQKYVNKTLIHVGDNEESDVHRLWDFNIHNEHIMQGKHLFFHTAYGQLLKNDNLSDNIVDSILYGLIINKKVFNSPFKLNHSKEKYVIETLEEFGYMIVGPLLLTFLLWVIQESKKEKNEILLFLAREGYYLHQLFELLTPILHFDKNKGIYFQTSRRCVTVANIRTEEDIMNLLNIEYYGNMKDFMHYRFGVDYNDKNFDIILCQDNLNDNRAEVEVAIKKYIPKILEKAEKERQSYLKYIKDTVGSKWSNLCVVDLGYSGTIQLYLSKLLNKKISGKYMVVKNNPKPLSIGCRVQSCFNELKNDNKHILYKNSLFLECFLTAPNGQLMYFDENQEPVFIEEKSVKEKFQSLEKIYHGVEELFKDMIELAGDKLMSYPINQKYILKIYEAFLLESEHFIEENREIFTFDDFYCRSKTIVVEKQSQ